ncbi:MAG TPA: metalloregulator ArsR/SmtB family transcription factor [Candidatus Binatia bacterium]|nr:metalloregulator ArsR/SmtB family transcription factor [Candidatus Binatia bacterium]
MSAASTSGRRRAAREIDALVGSKLFRALSEPARLAILKVLTVHGRADIAAIASELPQDRSVVSRHLAFLQEVGAVRREKVGRNVFFEIDGPAIVRQLEEALGRFRAVVPLCCPGDGTASAASSHPSAPRDGADWKKEVHR